MARISKRQKGILTVIFAASLSHGFVIVPGSRVAKVVPHQVGYASKQRRQFSIKKLHLSQDTKESTADEGVFSGDDSSASDGPLSLILLQAQDVLSPAAQALDDATDGWALGYADLSPENESTPIGQAFLATNIAYALVGVFLSMHGDALLGFLTEIVSIASFTYHYTQLQASSNRERDSTVRLALMVDYCLAFTTIFVGLAYLAMDQQLPPVEGLVSGGVGIACLLACWVWEQGLAYIVLHSLWHFFSAYCGFVIGNTHLSA